MKMRVDKRKIDVLQVAVKEERRLRRQLASYRWWKFWMWGRRRRLREKLFEATVTRKHLADQIQDRAALRRITRGVAGA
jgi:hypothetical protein